MLRVIFKLNPLILVFLLGGLHLLLMWPGILSSDSQVQYAMAISGVYSDHHPPLMSFVWRYLDRIISGSGLMFLLHLSLLYGAIFYLIKSINNFRYRFILLLFPLIPQIFFYSNMIWKDVGFAFSFLLVATYLGYVTSKRQQLINYKSWYKIVILLIILLYGTAIKFQARYCAPVLLIWMAYICANYSLYTKKFIKYLCILILGFYFALYSVNYNLISNIQKSHSWQNVKLYDLAAISVAINQDLFPIFVKNNNFTMIELTTKFNRKPLDRFKYYMVDDLIFGSDAILKIGVNEQERQQLYISWVKAVFQHPIIYFKHRINNMLSMLLYHPGFKYINKILGDDFVVLSSICNVLVYLIMANLIPAIICAIYFIFGIYILYKKNNNPAAVSLICFNAIGLIILMALFFCSMAGTPRYTYIMICMVHASHVFAYSCYKDYRELKTYAISAC